MHERVVLPRATRAAALQAVTRILRGGWSARAAGAVRLVSTSFHFGTGQGSHDGRETR